mmetsp:Transcript_8096/g.14634  ORF Transcript_8096/g.14634 Transcript_8096/m.14634 type:complete len:216 (+) Transcript_8096:79-726(+)|eukprot:CAMPEP_0201873012 /NCGR_PEP_ID=MMETSP0902-20130614/5613_1 /ASSEMBLY_ACC=CAM_ASM_000551 /TAXON_ID=420261 /ORGANISM="Thalassiosira antarctica, Strain CCMP982" /LENGTH=215 /DNA_ID=CAMNT_0048399481 /DNA_START=71 /DNA_END=718 /DNA_ORIENTATION=+
MAITNNEIGSRRAAEQQQPSSSSVEQPIDIEEGHEIGIDHLMPVTVAKSIFHINPHNEDSNNNIAQDDDMEIVVESIHHFKADDDDDSAPPVAPSSSSSGGGSRKMRSPCQSRRTKLFVILASIAVLFVVALSAGLGSASRKHGSSELEVTSAMMAAAEDADGEESTFPPTTSPTLPMAGSFSNDFDSEDNDDDYRFSNDADNGDDRHAGWIRRR